MPGTLVRDALAPNLLDATFDAAETITGSVVEVDWPHDVAFQLVLGTLDGSGATLVVEVEGADNSDFDEGVVSYGRFAPITEADDNEERWLNAKVYKRYLRAKGTTTGTVTSFPVDLFVREPHDHRVPNRTA